jgi:hypothetical protein
MGNWYSMIKNFCKGNLRLIHHDDHLCVNESINRTLIIPLSYPYYTLITPLLYPHPYYTLITPLLYPYHTPAPWWPSLCQWEYQLHPYYTLIIPLLYPHYTLIILPLLLNPYYTLVTPLSHLCTMRTISVSMRVSIIFTISFNVFICLIYDMIYYLLMAVILLNPFTP